MKKIFLGFLLIPFIAYGGKVKKVYLQKPMSSFFGSVKWQGTTNCQWTSTATSFTDYSADADCDDNARVIKGKYNITSGAVGDSDGQLPQIKFSRMPAGTYLFVATGAFENEGTGNYCGWRFTDGTSFTYGGFTYGPVTPMFTNHVLGVHTYSEPQGAKTWEMQASNAGGSENCDVWNNNAAEYSNLQISVFYYPEHGDAERLITK